jgi:hypothetical protein
MRSRHLTAILEHKCAGCKPCTNASRACGFTCQNGKAGGAGGRRALLPERERACWGQDQVLASPFLPLPPKAAKQAIRVNPQALLQLFDVMCM